MTLEKIIENAGLCPDPNYYSKKDAIIPDLSIKMLWKISNEIREHYGCRESVSFVSMVWKMKPLLVVPFLNNLFILEQANWDLSRISIN